MKHITKIRKIGNSQGVTIPVKSEDFGFAEGIEVIVTVEANKITIIPQTEQQFKSTIKSIIFDEYVFRPVFFERSEEELSPRFEEIIHLVEEGINGYDCKLLYDHLKEKYLGFVVGNNAQDIWFGRYLSEKAFQNIKTGANPYPYLLL